MKKALIHNNKIVQISDTEFETHPNFQWFNCPDDCSVDWAFDGTDCIRPTITLDQLKEGKKAESAAARYAAETSGVTANGRLFMTTREDVRILESAMDKIRRGLVEEVVWKCGDGKVIKLGANNIDNIEAAILTHIQGCFDNEALIAETIEACSSQEELSAIVITY